MMPGMPVAVQRRGRKRAVLPGYVPVGLSPAFSAMACSTGGRKYLLPRSRSRAVGTGIAGLRTVFVSRRRARERRKGGDQREDDRCVTASVHDFRVCLDVLECTCFGTVHPDLAVDLNAEAPCLGVSGSKAPDYLSVSFNGESDGRGSSRPGLRLMSLVVPCRRRGSTPAPVGSGAGNREVSQSNASQNAGRSQFGCRHL